ncbi:MAG: phosphate/phosphite/phosphonate ABC transporter substrate-binding protein [Nitrospirae bacterium]|nr:phosphate/phosphite/phosphonate ABC transporter substrate-binding protein [Nitrospirota bacterium]
MKSVRGGKLSALIFIIIGLTLLANCSQEDKPLEINLEKKEPSGFVERRRQEKPVRIAIGGMITPKEGFAYYRNFLDYVGEKLKRHVELVDRESYSEVNNLLKRGDIEAAFVCGGPYVNGHREFGMELLAAPVAYGGTVYYSYIIVAKDSPISSFRQLRGKSFAFTDPLSNSGKLAPTYMLAMMNESPDSFFRTYIYTRTHDNSIKAVAQGIVDGAAVDSLIWEYDARTNPVHTSKTKIIRKSPPYGIPPVVVRPGLDPALKEAMRKIFLEAHDDIRGREILKNMMIDRFVPIDNSAYDSIREMKAWIEKHASGEKP